MLKYVLIGGASLAAVPVAGYAAVIVVALAIRKDTLLAGRKSRAQFHTTVSAVRG